LPRKKNASALIPGIRLKKAMENGLAIVGPAALQGIFDDLERRGVRLESDATCSVEQLDSILREIFGDDASKLMMMRIYRELDSD
jgi:hypothetical protein